MVLVPQIARQYRITITTYCLSGLLLGLSLFTPSHAEEANWHSPEQVEGTITTSLSQAKALFDQGVVFIDVRRQKFFLKKHITGAYHLDLKRAFTRDALNKIATPSQPIVIYCSGEKCSRSYKASAKAVEWGYKEVHYFRAGVAAWRDANYPLTWAKPS